MYTYYTGSLNPEKLLNDILGSGMIKPEFHMSHDRSVAENYGTVIKITFEEDLTKAHHGLIGQRAAITGLQNAKMNGKSETVLLSQAAVNEFYFNLYDAEIV